MALAAAALLAMVMLATSCALPAPGQPATEVARADRDLVGRWLDAEDHELPDGTDESGILVIRSTGGSANCDGSNVTVFLELAWPAGRRLDVSKGDVEESDAPRYLRDSVGSAIETIGSSDLDASLPGSATRTGFHRDGNTISVVADDPSSVYVTRADGRIERWARLRDGAGCA
jgi:hypothetical protein